jgi:DNA-binding CsgD family transcriptional regulator
MVFDNYSHVLKVAQSSPDATSQTFDNLLFALNSAMDVESFWRANLRLFQHILPYHSCSLMLGIVGVRPSVARTHLPGEPSPDLRPISTMPATSYFLARHPRVKVYTFRQVFTEAPLDHRRRLEEDQASLGNWTEFVHLAFWDGSRPDAVLSIRRGPAQGDFSPQEVLALERLHPIIDAALHRLRTIVTERSQLVGMERFMTTLPLPIIFLDFEGKLSFASQEGYEACAAWNYGSREARVVNARRVFKLPVEIAQACEQVANNCRGLETDDGVVPVEGVRVQHPEQAGLVARVALSQPVRGPWAKPGFFVTFTMEKNLDGAAPSDDRASLLHLRPLSPSERRVALLVAEGCSNHAIAERLGKSERTVECQLNAIYHKLKLANRVQLARLLS